MLSEKAKPTIQGTFCFAHAKATPDQKAWATFDVYEELFRMGIPNVRRWRITEINDSYGLCDSYPRVLVVPADVSDQDLEGGAPIYRAPIF